MKNVFESVNSVSRTDFDKNHALNRIRQLNETVSILHSTINISTFFSRLDFAFEICDDLLNYKHTGVMQRVTPELQKQELVEQLPNYINSLITRCRDNAYNKAKELKTATGKHNRMIKFYTKLISDLNQYGSKYITDSNIDKIKVLSANDKVQDEIDITQLKSVKIVAPKRIVTSAAPVTTVKNISSNKKMICSKCKGIFIGKTICPDCDVDLIELSRFEANRTYYEPQKNSGCLAIAIVAIPVLFITILMWNFFKL